MGILLYHNSTYHMDKTDHQALHWVPNNNNPFTLKSDQFQISTAASPDIMKMNWAFHSLLLRWNMTILPNSNYSSPWHLCKWLGEYLLNFGVKGLRFLPGSSWQFSLLFLSILLAMSPTPSAIHPSIHHLIHLDFYRHCQDCLSPWHPDESANRTPR